MHIHQIRAQRMNAPPLLVQEFLNGRSDIRPPDKCFQLAILRPTMFGDWQVPHLVTIYVRPQGLGGQRDVSPVLAHQSQSKEVVQLRDVCVKRQ